MQSDIDYMKIGQRIKAARVLKGFTQFELGELTDVSNNHISHIESGQTKVSLSLLIKIASVLDKDIDYFLLDIPYTRSDTIINSEIADKLNHCSSATLIAVNRMIDIMIEYEKFIRTDLEKSL